MVFITPQFTKVIEIFKVKKIFFSIENYELIKIIFLKGISIMEAVAFGGKDAQEASSIEVLNFYFN